MDIDEQTLTELVEIDSYSLDKECVKIPSDYLKISFASSQAKKGLDEAKAEMEQISAALSKEIRDKPESFGLVKVTEAALSAAVVEQPEYQEAQAKFRDLQHKVRQLDAAVWAIDTKKRSLQMLVELHGMGYFSEVNVKSKQPEETLPARKARKPRGRD